MKRTREFAAAMLVAALTLASTIPAMAQNGTSSDPGTTTDSYGNPVTDTAGTGAGTGTGMTTPPSATTSPMATDNTATTTDRRDAGNGPWWLGLLGLVGLFGLRGRSPRTVPEVRDRRTTAPA